MPKSNELIMRRMEHSDIDRVMEVERECFSTPWSRECMADEVDNENSSYFVCETSGEIAGYIGMHTVLDEGDIMHVGVKGTFQKRGIATLLMERVILECRKKKVTRLMLEVRKGNAAATSLYKKFGFTVDGIRKNYYEKPIEDGVLMSVEVKLSDCFRD